MRSPLTRPAQHERALLGGISAGAITRLGKALLRSWIADTSESAFGLCARDTEACWSLVR
jgi:predicted tellurium resistance membrane protein TerC